MRALGPEEKRRKILREYPEYMALVIAALGVK